MYGGSAGAVVLGADIAIAAAADSNDVGIEDTRGLNRLAGAAVRPHYRPSLDAEPRHWPREQQHVVLALPERSGLVVTDAIARNVGPALILILSPDGEAQRLLSGDAVDLTSTQQP